MSNEHQELRQQLEELQRQVAVLQQQIKAPRQPMAAVWIMAVVVAVATGLFAGWMPLSATWAQPPDRGGPPGDRVKGGDKDKEPPGKSLNAEEIVCKSLKVLGPDGLPRVMLDMDKDGGVIKALAHNGTAQSFIGIEPGGTNGLILLKNTKGNTLIDLGGNQQGGLFTVRNPEGFVQIGMWASGKDSSGGLFSLRTPTGKDAVVIGPDKDGYSSLILRKDDNIQVGMWSGGKDLPGGVINLRGPNGKDTVFLGPHKDGYGCLTICNTDGKIQAGLWAGGKKPGGILNLRGPNGKDTVVMDSIDGIGALGLRDANGTELLFLGPDTKGNGIFDLRGSDNKTRVMIGPDANGIGEVTGRDASGAIKRTLKEQ